MVYRLHYEDSDGRTFMSGAIYNLDAIPDLIAEALALGLKVTKVEDEQGRVTGATWIGRQQFVGQPKSAADKPTS